MHETGNSPATSCVYVRVCVLMYVPVCACLCVCVLCPALLSRQYKSNCIIAF